jgi:telomerase reverse transcriptase
MSQSDFRKRLDLFHEFVYYAFDSLLIPLIRSHFFVTESNVHRYRVFFFRQDVWRSICEPQLALLKHTLLEEMSADASQEILDSRKLGFSQLRLLPKETGVRPIMNLRRRPVKKGHKKLLGSSINSLLAPVYNMYTYEKVGYIPKFGTLLMAIEHQT